MDVKTIVNTRKTDVVDPIAWKQIKGIAETFINSRALPAHIQNKEQLIMLIQAGYEMGMKPVEAINSLYIVNGQITIWGKALSKKLRQNGWSLDFEDGENQTKVIAVNRETGEKVEEIMTFEEAEKSGYTRDRSGKLKFGWKEGTNRLLKLRYGALNKLIKTKLGDVLGSAQGVAEVYEDYTDMVEEGEIIQELDEKYRKLFAEAKTQEELIKVAKKVKEELGDEYAEAIEQAYAQRKEEL